MNWTVVKEKFPNTHDELKAFDETTDLKDGFMIHAFLNRKGIKTGHLFIRKLREYEKSLNKNLCSKIN